MEEAVELSCDRLLMMMIFTSHAYNVEGTVTATVYLKKKAAAFETLYVCEVNIWTMEKVQRYFSDVSSAPLPRFVILAESSLFLQW